MKNKKILVCLSMIIFTTLFINTLISQAESTKLKSVKLKESEEINFNDLDAESQKAFKAQGFTENDKFYQSVNVDSN